HATSNLDPSPIPVPFVAPSDDPEFTSIAVAGAASSGGPAIAGAVIVDVFSVTADAHIGGSTAVNQTTVADGGFPHTASQTLSIVATNETTITDVSGGLGVSTSSVGVGGSLDVEVLNKTTKAYIGDGAVVTLGGGADIETHATETILSIVATAG